MQNIGGGVQFIMSLFACLLLLLFEEEDEKSRFWLGHVKYEKAKYKSQAEG